MKLSHKRVNFTRNLTRLLYHAELKGINEGFLVVIGEVKRHESDTHGHPASVHYAGLAAHLLLYTPNLDYPHPDEHRIYSDLHDTWESICGGAKRIEGDLNHFSYEHNGVR